MMMIMWMWECWWVLVNDSVVCTSACVCVCVCDMQCTLQKTCTAIIIVCTQLCVWSINIVFQIILQFLHFNDNAAMPARWDPTHDRLYKIRLVLGYLHSRFQEVYEPWRAVYMDESLLLWKGRLIFCQYIPLKLARFGIKIYLCCESDIGIRESGGYCYRFKVYTAREDLLTRCSQFFRLPMLATLTWVPVKRWCCFW